MDKISWTYRIMLKTSYICNEFQNIVFNSSIRKFTLKLPQTDYVLKRSTTCSLFQSQAGSLRDYVNIFEQLKDF